MAEQFRCVGRRYPNAPERTIAGCLARVPPRIFAHTPSRLTGEFAHLNGVELFAYHSGGPIPNPWILRQNWVWNDETGLHRQVIVWTDIDHSNFVRLHCEYRREFPTVGAHRRYSTLFFPGFDEWNDFHLQLSSVSGNWAWGGEPEEVQLRIGTYDRIPADTCIGV
jgi:hypothetical protein